MALGGCTARAGVPRSVAWPLLSPTRMRCNLLVGSIGGWLSASCSAGGGDATHATDAGGGAPAIDAAAGDPSPDAAPDDVAADEPLPACSGVNVYLGRQVLITELAVVEDPVRTRWTGSTSDEDDGAWHAGRLLADLVGDSG